MVILYSFPRYTGLVMMVWRWAK